MYFKLTAFQKKLFIKGKFNFYAIRIEKVVGNLTEMEKKPYFNSEEGSESFVISREELDASLKAQGLGQGPKTFLGILGEKVAIMGNLLHWKPLPPGVYTDIEISNSRIIDPYEAMRPDSSWSVHSSSSKLNPHPMMNVFPPSFRYTCDVVIRKWGTYLGASSNQESLESGMAETHVEAKAYLKSGVKKAVKSGEKSAWVQTKKPCLEVNSENLGEDVVTSFSNNLTILTMETPEQLWNKNLPEPEHYQSVNVYAPEDARSVAALEELSK